MKRIIFLCALCLFLVGCKAANNEVKEANTESKPEATIEQASTEDTSAKKSVTVLSLMSLMRRIRKNY
ncbi:MAG: hypothetical protein SOU08_00925 [Anaerococcus sp.]|nr:hypothetical protein [Anaerococcus sp.]